MNSIPGALGDPQPAAEATADDWVSWYLNRFLPDWINRASTADGFGFFDALDHQGAPVDSPKRTLLTQARLLHTFSHLSLATGNADFYAAARVASDALGAFRTAPGTYCRARAANRHETDDKPDSLAHSYEQCFVLLGLATWSRARNDDTESDVEAELEACWKSFTHQLTDKTTGLLLQHEHLNDPAAGNPPNRAQNPHMHLYEATLQAYEMTGDTTWLSRAAAMRHTAMQHFFAPQTGTMIGFMAPDLTLLTAPEGQRCEVGHQYEWAWLLYREAELGGDASVTQIADAMMHFADTYGLATAGNMKGAVFDAVSCDNSWREERFLLWPQTEAVKARAIRKRGNKELSDARHLMLLIFQRYFADHAAFVNQLDINGTPVWSEALSRLHYHLAVAVTEGARRGLWKLA